MDTTHTLLVIILILTAIIGVGIVVALALAISTMLQVFSLVKVVRTEVATVSGIARKLGEGLTDKLGGLGGFLIKTAAKRATRRDGR